MKLILEETDLDISKFEVNKEYRLEADTKKYGHITINRTLVTKVDTESNIIEFEPLVDSKQQVNVKSKYCKFTMTDKDGMLF